MNRNQIETLARHGPDYLKFLKQNHVASSLPAKNYQQRLFYQRNKSRRPEKKTLIIIFNKITTIKQ